MTIRILDDADAGLRERLVEAMAREWAVQEDGESALDLFDRDPIVRAAYRRQASCVLDALLATIPDVDDAAAELKPCPFCGSDAELEHDNDHHGSWFNLGCSKHWDRVRLDEVCPGARLWYTEDLENEAAAIEAWNTRAAIAAVGKRE